MKSRQSLNLFNCIFFAEASALTLAMVAPSWRYGFFFTPVPALLTIVFLAYVAGLVWSVLDMLKPQPWLGLPLSKAFRQASFLRWSALLLPMPMITYFAIASFVDLGYDGCPTHVEWAQKMINLDGFLFGHRRAECWDRVLAKKAYNIGRLDLAEGYTAAEIVSISKHFQPRDRRRITARTIKLAQLHMRMNQTDLAQQELANRIATYGFGSGQLSKEDTYSLAGLQMALGCSYDEVGDSQTADDLYSQAETAMNESGQLSNMAPGSHIMASGHVWEIVSTMPAAELKDQSRALHNDPADWNRWPQQQGQLSVNEVYPSLCHDWTVVNDSDFKFLQSKSNEKIAKQLLQTFGTPEEGAATNIDLARCQRSTLRRYQPGS